MREFVSGQRRQAVVQIRSWINRWDSAQQRRASLWRGLSAPQLFAGSFAFLVVIGTLGLKTLPGIYTGAELGWVDALFTATSAVCVTGLIVVDTATYFTTAGQAWILLLVQIGGLGIITFTTVIILALGRRLSLRHETWTTRTAELSPHVDHRALARDIIRFTFLFEIAGAVVLYALWVAPLGWTEAAWHALFHSVSAFCNAGFSTFSDSLMAFQLSPATLVTTMALIVVGGMGFLTLEELYVRRRSLRAGERFRLSLHSRIVLVATAALLLGAWALFTGMEWRVALADMPIWARPFNSLFMSVTARTAGFNTVDYDAVSGGSNFLTILLMSVGGSPGSAAGGLKTTTVVLIGLLAWSRFRGRDIVSVWGRSVPEETVQRAVGLFAVAFGVVTIAILGYVMLEMGAQVHSVPGHGFLSYMFEAASAFNTVGLSMGVTSELSTPSRWLTIALMFMGRVGPLTFAAAITLARPTPAGGFRFAYEEVIIG